MKHEHNGCGAWLVVGIFYCIGWAVTAVNTARRYADDERYNPTLHFLALISPLLALVGYARYVFGEVKAARQARALQAEIDGGKVTIAGDESVEVRR